MANLDDKGMKTGNKLVFLLIFLILVGTRLYFGLQTPNLHDSAYQDKRYVESILEDGKPMVYDSLSYNGKEVIYSPSYYYILAFFVFVFGSMAFKLIPILFISSLVFVIYGITRKISKDKNLSLFIALMSGFLPIIFVGTLNKISVYTLILPIVFYLIYLLINLKKKDIEKYLFFVFILSLLHPIALLFLVVLILYIIITTTESLRLNKLEKEVILFSVFLILLVEFFVYKKAFLEHGVNVIWGNVPKQVLGEYFNLNFLNAIYKVGIPTILFGVAGLVIGFIKKRKSVFLLGSVALSSLLLMVLKLAQFKIALMFFGVSLIVLSVIGLKEFLIYLEKTKLSDTLRKYLYVLVIGFFIVLLLVPSYIDATDSIKNETPSEYEILVLQWIDKNALPDITILTPLEKGHIVSGIGGKRTVIDESFLLAPDSSQRYRDVQTIYSTKSEVEALELIYKYNVDYILIPVETELKYGKVKWLDDKGCFEEIFVGDPKLYKIIC